MGHCWKKLTIDYALAQVGKVCGKTNEFSKEMDSIGFYNYPKNGSANSCKIFVDNSILHGCTDPTPEEDIEAAKWTALAVTYEPQSKGANAGAGCVQSVGYYKKAGAWINNPQDMVCGDEIYYANPDYATTDDPDGIYHTGLIVDWGEYDELDGKGGFKVVEGNTDGGYVAIKFVSYDDPKIYGAGRPDYDGWDPYESNDSDNNEMPEPTPQPDPVEKMVTVELPILYKGIDAYGEVLTIQALLNGFGLKDDDGNMLTVDGIFGSRTEQAVRNYQKSRGLEICGIVNAETWNRILK